MQMPHAVYSAQYLLFLQVHLLYTLGMCTVSHAFIFIFVVNTTWELGNGLVCLY